MNRVILSYVLLLSLGYIDYITGYEVRLGSIYLLIVALAAWNFRPLTLAIYSLALVAVWTTANRLSGLHYSRPWLVYWNMGNLLGSVGITAISVFVIKTTLDEQHRLIRELRRISLDTRQLRSLIPVCRLCGDQRSDPEYRETLKEYLQENADSDAVGGICTACLQARADRIARISVSERLQKDAS